MSKNILIISGIDPSGGAGAIADTQVATQLNVHSFLVPSLHTVQHSKHCKKIISSDPKLFSEQLHCLFEEQATIGCIKIGAITMALIPTLLQCLDTITKNTAKNKNTARPIPIVIDPILAPTNGRDFINNDDYQMYVALLNKATLITPNQQEFHQLNKRSHHKLASPWLLITGNTKEAQDNKCYIENTLYSHDKHTYITERTWNFDYIPKEIHGTGCTLSTAIACCIAHGKNIIEACDHGQAYTNNAVKKHFYPGQLHPIPNRINHLNI